MNRRVLGPTAAGCFAAVLTVLLSNASPVSAQETATLEPEVGRAFEFDEGIEDDERGRLLRLRGQAKRTLSDWAGWVTDWEEALALLEAVGDREAVA